MVKRQRFALVFSSNPAAADILREDDLKTVTNEELHVGAECSFDFRSKDGHRETVCGKIIETGTKVKLSKILVDSNGQVLMSEEGGAAVGTRKQELEKRRMREVRAKEDNLQDLAGDLLFNGPESVSQRCAPAASRLPKKHNLGPVKEMLKDLDCFKQAENKTEIIRGMGVWLESGTLALHKQRYKLRPGPHFLALFKSLVPTEILRTGGVSATGKRGCISFPNKLVEVVNMYVIGVLSRSGGDTNKANYDPVLLLRNLIGNSRNGKGTNPTSPPPQQSSTCHFDTSSAAKNHEIAAPSLNPPMLTLPPPHSPIHTASVTFPVEEHSYCDLSSSHVIIPFSHF